MGLITIKLTNKKPMSDKKLLACKINGMKTPKPGRAHPWRRWVSTPAVRTRSEFEAEAKLRRKKIK